MYRVQFCFGSILLAHASLSFCCVVEEGSLEFSVADAAFTAVTAYCLCILFVRYRVLFCPTAEPPVLS